MHPYDELRELVIAYNDLLEARMPKRYEVSSMNGMELLEAARSKPENQHLIFLGKGSIEKTVVNYATVGEVRDRLQSIALQTEGDTLRLGEIAFAKKVLSANRKPQTAFVGQYDLHSLPKNPMVSLHLLPHIWEAHIDTYGVEMFVQIAGKILPRAGFPDFVEKAYKIAVLKGKLKPYKGKMFPFDMDRHAKFYMGEYVRVIFAQLTGKNTARIAIREPVKLFNPDSDVVRMVADRLFISPE